MHVGSTIEPATTVRAGPLGGVAIIAAMIILAACGPGSSPVLVERLNQTASSAIPGNNEQGVPPQLQFSATTLGGEDFEGESLQGKPAVLWFWAPGNPTCQREATMVGRLAKAHLVVAFVGAASASELPAIQKFVEKYQLTSFTQLADTIGLVWAKFHVTSQPASAFITSYGEVNVITGDIPENELNERLAAMTHQ